MDLCGIGGKREHIGEGKLAFRRFAVEKDGKTPFKHFYIPVVFRFNFRFNAVYGLIKPGNGIGLVIITEGKGIRKKVLKAAGRGVSVFEGFELIFKIAEP